MGKKSTVLMILFATVLALGLTVYGESLESNDHKESNIVEINTPIDYRTVDYTNIHKEITD